MSLQEGQVFAGYTILRRLGSGGMGEVFLAQHPRLPRHDAIKILHSHASADAKFRQRFNREADLASQLFHPHIVGVFDRGEFEGQLWISMAYIAGSDVGVLLDTRFPRGLPADQTVDIIGAVASALDYAHTRQLLHRDVKPANVLLADSRSGPPQIFLADFGIARQTGEADRLTAAHVAVGTMAYMSPEQLSGAVLDGRSDQYSLACTAFHIFTGAPPFTARDAPSLIGQLLTVEAPAISSRRRELSSTDGVFARALAKDPRVRYPTCADFAGELAQRLAERGLQGQGLQDRGPQRRAPFVPENPTVAMRQPATVNHPPVPAARYQPPDPPRPPPGPPPILPAQGGRRRTRRRLAIVGAVSVVLVAAVVAAVAVKMTGGSDRPAAQAIPPIDELLLTVSQMKQATGKSLTPGDVLERLGNDSAKVDSPECAPALYVAQVDLYSGADSDSVRQQTSKSAGNNAFVDQSVVIFATADEARRLLQTAQTRWQSCTVHDTFTLTNDNGSYQVSLDDVVEKPDTSFVLFRNTKGAVVCQHAIGIKSTIVAEARACSTDVSDQAVKVVGQILSAVP